jgi:hypothetical protein
VLDAGGVVLHLDIGNRMRPALVADQQAVALGVVARRSLALGCIDTSPR